jgi:hypothetical protein
MAYRKKRSRLRSFYFALRFTLKKVPWKGLIFVLIGVLLFFFVTQQWIRAYASLDWQTTQGKVTTSKAIPCSRRYHRFGSQASIVYKYSVHGASYSSNNITFAFDSLTRSCGNAEKVITQYPLGKSVVVYYDPKNPEQSVLRPGGTSFLGIGFSLLSLIFGINLSMSKSNFVRAKMIKRKPANRIPMKE